MARVKIRKLTKSWMKVRPDHRVEEKVVVRHHWVSKVESVEHEEGTGQDDVVVYSSE